MADKIEVELVFDPIFGTRAKKKIVDESEDAGKKSGKKFNKGFSSGLSSLGKSLGGVKSQITAIGAALGAAFAFRGLVGAVSEIEKLETGLTTLLGSAGLAKETLQDLQSFAARTPFQLTGIAESANQLLAFGFAQDTIIDRLEILGDVAAGSNSELKDVALIFGQVSAAGKLTGERLLQLQERAIPIGSALAKSLGVAESQVRTLVSEGKVGFKEFEEAFKSLTTSGGLFEGALARQSKTVGGVLSTLRDNFFNLQIALGRAFAPAIISTANSFIKIFQSFSDKVTANGPVLTRTFSRLADIFAITPAKFWLNFFAGDGAASLQETNKEISNLENQLALAEKRLKGLGDSSKDGFFDKLLGGRKQALQDIGDFSAKLTELRKRRDDLTVSNNNDTTAVKNGLAAKKQLIELENKRIEQELKLKEIRSGLGGIGLTREQQIQEQGAKDLEALREARTAEAITEDEFAERKLVREQLLQDQLSNIRSQQSEKRKQGIDDEEKAALDGEKTLSDSLSRTAGQFKSVAGSFRKTSRDIAKSLVNGIGNAAASGFAAFGKALVTGENALKAFGEALLQAFGQSLVQLGTGFILQGVAQSLAGFGTGGPLIAAGAALVTFGSALSALTSGASQASGGGGGDFGGGVAADGGFDNTATAQQEEREEPDTRVALTINGDVFDSEQTGTRIAQILSDASLNNGIVISNGNFA